MRFRPMPLLTGLSLISLGILIWLGNWQYARYADKMENGTEVAQAAQAEQFTIELDRSVEGNVQQVYGFADSEPIWRQYAAGRVSETQETVIVMIGATGGPEPVSTALSSLPASITMEGIIAEKPLSDSAFSAKDRPELDQWYRLDSEKIAARLSVSGAPKVAEPIVMTVRNADDLQQSRFTLNPYAYAEPLDPLPPERHFGYALTWWGMAIGLIGVYAALHRARGRLKF